MTIRSLSEQTKAVIAVFDRARQGTGMVTWEQIEGATGADRIHSRNCVVAAVEAMLKIGAVFESKRGIGYQRLPPKAVEEHVKRTALKRSHRQSARAVEKLDTVGGHLSDNEIAAWAGVAAVARKVYEVADPKRLARVQRMAMQDHYRQLPADNLVNELHETLR